MNRRRMLIGGLACAGAAGLSLPRSAAAQAPSARTVRIVVPFQAGTVTDTTTRIILPALAETLGQTVIVDNRAGADGAIGAMEVARAAPDGATLLMSTNGFAAVPALRKAPPYDPHKDFTPISMVARFSFFLFVNSELPVRTMDELIAYARKHPGALNYATGNPTGIVATSQMAALAGIKMVHVPYKGEPAAMTDLATNRVQLMFATMTTAGPHLTAGKLRMLATTLPQRSPAFPDVPTMAEAGFPAFAVASWAALQGPAGLPPATARHLADAVAGVLARPNIKEALLKQNVIPAASTPEELAAYISSQVALYARTLKDAGIQPE